MKLSFNWSYCVIVGLLVNVVGVAQAASEQYPERTIRLVVPQSPGSIADIMARALSKPLGDKLGQTIVVDNRPGASGAIAAQAVASAKPDGYTLFIGSVSTHGLLSSIDKNLAYDPLKDFEPVAQINDSPLALIVHPSSGISSMRSLVEKAKANPGKLSYGSAGNSSGSRFIVELWRIESKLDMLHVPYKSPAEAVRAVVANEVTLGAPSLPSVPELIKAGRVKAIAVTSRERSPILPDVPTTAEAGFPSVVFYSWTGIFAPAHTPPAIVSTLNRAIQSALTDPAVVKVIEDTGARVVTGNQKTFKTFVESEVAKWSNAAEVAGIR